MVAKYFNALHRRKKEAKVMDKEWMILGNRLEGRNICMTKINCLEDWGVNFRK